MERLDNGTNDPYLEVWHPRTPDADIFDKVGEVQLIGSKAVEEVDNNNNIYWLVNVTLNDDDRIEFEAGDFIGYYHPPDTLYRLWNIETTGYTIYIYDDALLNSIGSKNWMIKLMEHQPLIQLTIGMNLIAIVACNFVHTKAITASC